MINEIIDEINEIEPVQSEILEEDFKKLTKAEFKKQLEIVTTVNDSDSFDDDTKIIISTQNHPLFDPTKRLPLLPEIAPVKNTPKQVLTELIKKFKSEKPDENTKIPVTQKKNADPKKEWQHHAQIAMT